MTVVAAAPSSSERPGNGADESTPPPSGCRAWVQAFGSRKEANVGSGASSSSSKMVSKTAWGKPVKTFTQKCAEIERCNDLRARIKTYCKQVTLTQPEYAEKIRVSAKQISLFMTGRCLSGSEVYKKSMKFLRDKMPLYMCEEERAKTVNNKFVVRYF
jgi:hypothetical protein